MSIQPEEHSRVLSRPSNGLLVQVAGYKSAPCDPLGVFFLLASLVCAHSCVQLLAQGRLDSITCDDEVCFFACAVCELQQCVSWVDLICSAVDQFVG